jgi:phage repressor protein C with HTH and peptisase S24 domain
MSSELTFRARFSAVAGSKPYAWGKDVGLDKAFITNCLRSTDRPQQKNLEKLAAATGIHQEWWLHGDLPPPKPDGLPGLNRRSGLFSFGAGAGKSQSLAEQAVTDYVAIPLYNGVHAAAGAGAVVEHERPDDMLMFKESWVRHELGASPKDLYLIRVSGDSMEPTLRAGDVILVNRRATKPDREGVYILRLNGMLVVKRLQAMPGGRVRIISDNAAFTSFDVTNAELGGSDIRVIGRVVWIGRRI